MRRRQWAVFTSMNPRPSPWRALYEPTPSGTQPAADDTGKLQADAASPQADDEMTVEELKQVQDSRAPLFLLDVREPQEFQICRIPGSTLIPLGDLPDRFTELDANREIIAQCKSGMRSARAASFLREHGFKNVKNLKGGVLAWVTEVDPSQPKY